MTMLVTKPSKTAKFWFTHPWYFITVIIVVWQYGLYQCCFTLSNHSSCQMCALWETLVPSRYQSAKSQNRPPPIIVPIKNQLQHTDTGANEVLLIWLNWGMPRRLLLRGGEWGMVSTLQTLAGAMAYEYMVAVGYQHTDCLPCWLQVQNRQKH